MLNRPPGQKRVASPIRRPNWGDVAVPSYEVPELPRIAPDPGSSNIMFSLCPAGAVIHSRRRSCILVVAPLLFLKNLNQTVATAIHRGIKKVHTGVHHARRDKGVGAPKGHVGVRCLCILRERFRLPLARDLPKVLLQNLYV